MKVVTAGFKFINEPTPAKQIERVARVCYKSEDKIGDGTSEKMVKMLLDRKHLAMIEFGELCFEVSNSVYNYMQLWVDTLQKRVSAEDMSYHKSFLRFTSDETSSHYIISGNLRAWWETLHIVKKSEIPLVSAIVDEFECYLNQALGLSDNAVFNLPVDIRLVTDYSKLSNAERMVHETFTLQFTVDRGVSHEIVRMRNETSFAHESTRYCNYSLGKHGKQITVVDPLFFNEGTEAYNIWKTAMEAAEKAYLELTETLKIPAQQARSVLPQSTKGDIVVKANLIEWRHIFELRACDATGPAHPQMKEVMVPCCINMQRIYPFAFGDLKVASV